MKDFPIPVVALGPGTQTEDEGLDYVHMPVDMDTYRPPVLPDESAVAASPRALAALRGLLAALDGHLADGVARGVDLRDLGADELALVNQVLGEGEASAIVSSRGDASDEWRVQESVFAGVWRVLRWRDGALVDDRMEVAPVPQGLREIARQDALGAAPAWQGALPAGVQNAPMLVDEVRDQAARWRAGQPPHVVNLSLLPVTPEDIGFLDHQLGTGRVLMLSRGYGNCRITNTCVPNTWRVVYYNSMDKVILNTVEVVDMPEVALAAQEDLRDSRERLADVLDWVSR